MAAKRKGYFYEKEEQAVIDYINAPTLEEKNRIFSQVLYFPLTKMIEAIIRRYKLYVPDEEFYQTFTDVFSYLMMQLDKFDPSKGCKAYSYCGTICKNYLYYKNKQFSINQKKSIPYDDVYDEINNNIKYSEYQNKEDSDVLGLMTKTVGEIKKMVADPILNGLSDDEIKVGKALICLMENWDDILSVDGSRKLCKSSVLYFLREETMMTTSQVRKNMKPYRLIYKLLKKIQNKEQ